MSDAQRGDGQLSPADALPSADLLRTLFERAPVVITLLDDQARQVMVNAAGLQMLGFEESLRRPENGWSYIHPDDLAVVTERMLEMIGRPVGTIPDEPDPAINFRIQVADGSWRWLELVVTDMRDVPGLHGFVSFSRDVTDREERAEALVRSAAQLRALVASLQAGAFVDDADGVITLTNDRLAELLDQPGVSLPATGATTTELLDRIARVLVDPSVLDPLARDDPVDHLTVSATTQHGRDLTIERTPITAEGERLGRLWLIRDATLEREEERRTRALLELEQQARHAAETQAQQLADYDQLRNDFVARVSHDLRTPLTAIASATELLLTDPVASPDRLREHLAIIGRNADRLQSLIEDLLLVSRLDAHALTLDCRMLRLASLVDDLVASLAPAAVTRGVTVVSGIDADLQVWSDPRRLTDILLNLLDNAIKFTAPDSQVELGAVDNRGEVTIIVRDHGPGVPEDLRAAVFERFVRSPEADRSPVPGAGLGLAIVQGLVDLHGGSVAIEDAEGGGAEVRVTLPAGPRGRTGGAS